MAVKMSRRPKSAARTPSLRNAQPAVGSKGVDRLLITLEALREAQEELRESAEELAMTREAVETERRRYQELFEFAPDGYVLTDDRGVIQEANRAALELLAIAPEFLIGKPLVLYVARERRGAFHTQLRQAGETASVGLLETTLLPRGRRPIIAELRTAAVRSAFDRVVGFRWLIRDVTERHEAEGRVRAYGEQLLALWARLESVREEERTRIAREIHDEFGQAITALRFDLETLTGNVAGVSGDAEAVARMKDQLATMLTSARRIARELRPAALDDLGLEAAAEFHCRDFAARTGIACPFDSTLGETAVPGNVATAAFRILQEALTNVARHAAARTARVRLAIENNHLQLTVADDGEGISPERVSDGASLGILGMRERARMLGGTLLVGPVREGGTRVSLSVPVAGPVP